MNFLLLAESVFESELARETAKLAFFITGIGALSWVVEAILRRCGK